MSSCGNPEVETDAVMPRKRKYDKTRKCVKCKENAGNVVIRHAVYCRGCFVPLMTFKFRRSLEPYVNANPDGPRRTALKPTGNLLIGLSGGLGSTVLLDLVHRFYISPDPALLTSEGGSHHPRNERVWKKAHVCYVETSDVIPGTKDQTEEIKALVETLAGVEFIPLRIQDAFSRTWWQSVIQKNSAVDVDVDLTDEMLPFVPRRDADGDPLASLQSYLASLPTPTALPTTLTNLTRVLLQYTAVKTGSSHLLLGTTLTSLAVSLISGVAYGGGFHVREEVQEEWIPDFPYEDPGKGKSVRVIRPLRDISVKECAVWAWWWKLRIVGREQWVWPGAKPGIGRLTKDFIRGLETDYPSTVSTIVRTCGKLAPKGVTSGQCVLCKRPAQDGVQDWKGRIAIRSRSEVAPVNANPAAGHTDPLVPHLCYICHTTLTSKATRAPPSLYSSGIHPSTTITMPSWTTSSIINDSLSNHAHDEDEESEVVSGRIMGQEELRKAIDDFILDD